MSRPTPLLLLLAAVLAAPVAPEQALGGSLYERFEPREALRMLNKIEFHYTPSTAVG